MLWFKDTIVIVSSGGNTHIINIDFKNEIKSFADHYAASDFDNIIIAIEKAILNIKNNVFSQLVLTVLGIQIKRNLQRINT
jgi:hypothetical protein